MKKIYLIGMWTGLQTLLLWSCSDRLFDNPYDPRTPKDDWAPKEFRLKLTNSNQLELTWSQPDSRIDGFVLQKKISGTTNNLVLDRYTLAYTDMEVNPDVENPAEVEYILQATAGDQLSTELKVKSAESFPFIVKDVEGTSYKTIGIGAQIWMAENLRTSKYRNGDKIDYVTDPVYWASLSAGGNAHYGNIEGYDQVYARLYNWYAVGDSRGLCPTGWHIPTVDEWYDLASFLGGTSVAGGKMKQSGTDYWLSPNEGATNESGFSALPGGLCEPDGTFKNLGADGAWWASTESDVTGGWYASLLTNDARIFLSRYYKNAGFSVRCLKD